MTMKKMKMMMKSPRREMMKSEKMVKSEDYEEEISMRTKKQSRPKGTKNKWKITENIDALVKELCQDATVLDEFAGKCQFKCTECKGIFSQWVALRNHSRNSHCARVLMGNVSNYLIKKACYKCRICSNHVLGDSMFFRRHLMLKHKMQVKEYSQTWAKRMRPNRAYSQDIISVSVQMCGMWDVIQFQVSTAWPQKPHISQEQFW